MVIDHIDARTEHLYVLNRAGLEDATCECCHVMRGELDELFKLRQ
jgi:hypothetical protein